MRTPVGAGRLLPASTVLRAVMAAAFAAIGTVLVAAPGSAHPFGEPQSARISAEGAEVIIRWLSPPDDLLVLGGSVGALPDRRTYVFDVSPQGVPQQVGTSDAELIAGSPEVAAYLADHLAVRQDGRECEPNVSLDGLVAEGALVVFKCARKVTEVEIEITMLTDIHDAYRTAAVGGDSDTVPDHALYTADDTTHRWTFGAAVPGGVSPVPWLVGALVALAGAGVWVLRRTGTRTS